MPSLSLIANGYGCNTEFESNALDTWKRLPIKVPALLIIHLELDRKRIT